MPLRMPVSRLRATTLPLLLLALLAAPHRAAAFGVPAMVKDINPGAAASSPVDLFVLGTRLVFFASDGVAGIEPWVSDGTGAGTVMLKDVWAGASGGFNPGCTMCNAIQLGSVVYFSASDGSGGSQLWKTDGTSAGTVKVFAGTTASDLTAVGGAVFFAGQSGLLEKSDGTAAGTVQVESNAYQTGEGITDVNGTAYFPASDGFTGDELWRSDGSIANAVRVKDLWPGSSDSYLQHLTNCNGTLYFFGSNGVTAGIYKTDGTDAGTVQLHVVGTQGGASIDPRQIVTTANGKVWFIGSDPANGFELWTSDGTPAGTAMVKDIYPGSYGGLTGSALVPVGNTVYFFAADDVDGF